MTRLDLLALEEQVWAMRSQPGGKEASKILEILERREGVGEGGLDQLRYG